MEGKGGRRQRRAGRAAGAATRRSCCSGSGGLAVGVLFGSAAPQMRARHCRAKIGGAASPTTSPVSENGRRHVSLLPRHHAWHGTGIWPRQGNRRGQKC